MYNPLNYDEFGILKVKLKCSDPPKLDPPAAPATLGRRVTVAIAGYNNFHCNLLGSEGARKLARQPRGW